jgi:hypothetical protein
VLNLNIQRLHFVTVKLIAICLYRVRGMGTEIFAILTYVISAY